MLRDTSTIGTLKCITYSNGMLQATMDTYVNYPLDSTILSIHLESINNNGNIKMNKVEQLKSHIPGLDSNKKKTFFYDDSICVISFLPRSSIMVTFKSCSYVLSTFIL